jgi:hypothetical protein
MEMSSRFTARKAFSRARSIIAATSSKTAELSSAKEALIYSKTRRIDGCKCIVFNITFSRK